MWSENHGGIEIISDMDGWLHTCGPVDQRWMDWWKNVEIDRWHLEEIKSPFSSSTRGIYCSRLIYYLLSLTSGVNVPYLGNKNNLERQLPQVKLYHFPGSSLLSVSIEIFSIYFGKLKQLLSCPPRAGISQSSRFIIIILTMGGEKMQSRTISQAWFRPNGGHRNPGCQSLK